MPLNVSPDCQTACRNASRYMTDCVQSVLHKKSRCTIALSGGSTPWPMLADFFAQALPWTEIHLFQVDERLVPAHSPERNWSHLVPLIPSGLRIHPVSSNLAIPADELAEAYEAELIHICGNPPQLDLIHLGLGADGHTASLAPSDPVIEVVDRFVAAVGSFHGQPRLTLTRPTLNRGMYRLWLACGSDKQDALVRWLARDPAIPAGQVGGLDDSFFCDQAARPSSHRKRTTSKLQSGFAR
ncbi:MAG: 6-phosphogluconolactonase [Gammaproteobacteria bacterium]